MTMRIGWFSPISGETGIASYTAQVLEALCASRTGGKVEVIVFHPAFDGPRVEMPCPTIELSDALLGSDFWALFDVAIYHLGNNSRHHAPIYTALRRHPGMVVLHDHVYQHYLAGVSLRGDFVGPSYVTLAQNANAGSFNVLKSSGVMHADQGQVDFVPWESEWAARVPLSDRFVDLGLSTLVHSDYARQGLRSDNDTDRDILTLFMPRPDVVDMPPPQVTAGPVRIACCGHIGGTKGLLELVNSFIQAPHLRSSFHVTIAGFGSDTVFLDTLRKTISEAHLNAVFDIKIAPSDAEYKEIMAQCDVFYNLRYPNTEGASLSLMEQLAYGRPVIAYRTGSFAEVPEEACYFLDAVGDTQCLVDTLGHIARNLPEIEIKGRAAQAAVADKTAQAYAAGFLRHVRANLKTYQRRARLSHMRADGVLVDGKKDTPWLLRFLRARKEMKNFYAGTLYVPDNFVGMSVETKGTFVAANYLNTSVDLREARRIGNVIEGLSGIALYDLLGKLLTIASLGQDHKMLPAPLRSMALPITDTRVWRILSALPDAVGGFLGLHTLGIPMRADTHAGLTASIEAHGFRQGVRYFLNTYPGLWEKRIAITPLAAFLEDTSLETMAALPPVPLDVNLLDHLRETGDTGPMALQGFHTLETVGIWTSDTSASIQLNLPGAATLRAAHGVVAVLPESVEAGDTVTLSIEDMASNIRVQCAMSFEDTIGNSAPWELDLENASGPLLITLETRQLHTLSQDGVTGDTRALGALLQSLVLQQQSAPTAELF